MEKKELIRQSAIKVIAQEGYSNTTVKMIANQAEVAVGTVYNYFTTKEEILNYIFLVEFDKRVALLNDLQVKNISLRKKLTIFLDNHFNQLEEDHLTAIVLVQESKLPKKHNLTAVDDFMNKLPKLLAKMIEQAQEREEIRKVNSPLIANAIFNAIRGVATTVVQEENYNFSQAKRELINYLWLGLKKVN